MATAAFAGVGLLMAGTLRAEMTLAAANGLYLLLLLTSGMVVPLVEAPGERAGHRPRPPRGQPRRRAARDARDRAAACRGGHGPCSSCGPCSRRWPRRGPSGGSDRRVSRASTSARVRSPRQSGLDVRPGEIYRVSRASTSAHVRSSGRTPAFLALLLLPPREEVVRDEHPDLDHHDRTHDRAGHLLIGLEAPSEILGTARVGAVKHVGGEDQHDRRQRGGDRRDEEIEQDARPAQAGELRQPVDHRHPQRERGQVEDEVHEEVERLVVGGLVDHRRPVGRGSSTSVYERPGDERPGCEPHQPVPRPLDDRPPQQPVGAPSSIIGAATNTNTSCSSMWIRTVVLGQVMDRPLGEHEDDQHRRRTTTSPGAASWCRPRAGAMRVAAYQ